MIIEDTKMTEKGGIALVSASDSFIAEESAMIEALNSAKTTIGKPRMHHIGNRDVLAFS